MNRTGIVRSDSSTPRGGNQKVAPGFSQGRSAKSTWNWMSRWPGRCTGTAEAVRRSQSSKAAGLWFFARRRLRKPARARPLDAKSHHSR
jgi:hypothetical protein